MDALLRKLRIFVRAAEYQSGLSAAHLQVSCGAIASYRNAAKAEAIGGKVDLG
jgi:hypothetical protein